MMVAVGVVVVAAARVSWVLVVVVAAGADLQNK